jgi:hypothetical protein
LNRKFGAAKLPMMTGLDLAAKRHAKGLLAIAYAQDRHARIQYHRINRGRIFVQGRRRAARQNHAFGLHHPKSVTGVLKGMDFAINAGLANTTRDQLGDLRAEVDDEDGLRMV